MPKKWKTGVDCFGKKFKYNDDLEWEYVNKKKKGGRKNMRQHCCPSVKRPKRNFYLKRYPHSYKKYRCRRPRK